MPSAITVGANTIGVGERLFEVKVRFKNIIDFGTGLLPALTGQTPIPLTGARVDVEVEGTSVGKIQGKVIGTDYLYLRPDGHNEVHIHGRFETEDGARIAFLAQGVSTPAPSGKQFLEAWTVTLSSSFPAYKWVNELPVWTQGVCNIGEAEIVVQGYATSS